MLGGGVGSAVGDGEDLLALEVCYEGCASFGLRSVEVLLELRVLGLQEHGYLFGLLLPEVGLLLRAIRGGMAVLVADSAAYIDRTLDLEWTGPSPVSILLAILAVILIDALNLHIVAIQQFLQFLILLPVEYLLHLLHSLLQLVVIIRNDYDMQRLVVLKNILLRLVGPSASHCDLAARPLLDQLLRLAARTDDLANVVGLGITDCILC